MPATLQNLRQRTPRKLSADVVGTRYHISHTRVVEAWHAFLRQREYPGIPPVPIPSLGQCEMVFIWGKWCVCNRYLVVRSEYVPVFEEFREQGCAALAQAMLGKLASGQFLVYPMGTPVGGQHGQNDSEAALEHRGVLSGPETLDPTSTSQESGSGSEGGS